MAQTSYVDIPAGMEEAVLKVLKSGDRFQYSKIVRNDTLLSKSRKAGITNRSLLPQLSIIWQAMTDEQRTAWATAGGYCNMKGWNLFVQDQCLRIKNDMEGVATPVIEHQSWVGSIRLGGSANEIKLAQFHPSAYWVERRVTGKKGMYYPVKVTEILNLPLTIGLSYKTDLTADGPNPSVRFYAKLINSYQGKDDSHELSIPLGLQDDWTIETAELENLRGTIIGYALYFHLQDVQGDLWFDNVKAIHGATNWARDPKCTNIDTTFTRAFSQIPKHWVATVQPDGAEYDSVYQDF